MTLPPKYAYLLKPGVPRMVSEALKLLGTLERPGPANSPEIMGWKKELTAAGRAIVGFSGDNIPWCGLFVAYVAFKAGKQAPDGPLWALNWRKFGVNPDGGASLGDVLIFTRPGGGGHVGLYVGEDATHYHVLGGNQSDAVTITRIAKTRCVAARRPLYKNKPASAAPVVVASSGAVSNNEA